MSTRANEIHELPLPVAALRLGISWERAWRRLLEGRLQGRKVKGRWLVTAESVERELKREE